MSVSGSPGSSSEESKRLAGKTVFRSRLAQYNYSPSSASNMAPAAVATPTRTTRSTGRTVVSTSKTKLDDSPNPASTSSRSTPIPNRQTTTPISTTAPTTPSASRRRKRATSQSTTPPSTLKKHRSTTKQRSANDPYTPINRLVDALRPSLTLVFIGLNPGLKTAETGHAYSHPSNLFWKLLHWSGVTPLKHLPSETHDMMDLYSIGNTNLCVRATRSGDGLTAEEHMEGAKVVQEKIGRFRPEAVCVVGKGVWEWLWHERMGRKMKKDEFKWGWQDDGVRVGRVMGEDGKVVWGGAKTFVSTSTSGLAASLRPNEKLEIWKPLGEWFTERREELQREGRLPGPKAGSVEEEAKAEDDDGIKIELNEPVSREVQDHSELVKNENISDGT